LRNTLVLLAALFFTGLSIAGRGFESERGERFSLMLPVAQATAGVFTSAQVEADKIVIKDAWIQEGPPSQKITAAFMLIENHNAAEISLLAASTEVARVVELHKIELEDGMMRMRKVDSINVPAGGMVELKPGGYHLMVIDVNKELKEGNEVKVQLQFSGAIQKTLMVPVKSRSSMSKEEELK
jgi:copper(I)-binding protein